MVKRPFHFLRISLFLIFMQELAYLQKKDYTNALKTLEKGFKYAEDENIYLQYCIFIAEAYNGLQNHEKSFEFYEKALSIDSTNQLIYE